MSNEEPQTTTAIAPAQPASPPTAAPAAPTGLKQFAGLDPAEYKALKDALAPGAPDADFKVHLLLCQRLGIFPGPGGQAHFVSRKTKRNNAWVDVWTTQIGIDGYESLAEDTGLYEGPAGLPEFQYVNNEGQVDLWPLIDEFGVPRLDEEGRPVLTPWTPEVLPRIPYAAKVGVYRKGWREPVRAVATYRQYVQLTKRQQNGQEVWLPNAMWAKMPHRMLAKCAEALALRQAFPRQLGLVYTHEEMGQAQNGAPTTGTATVRPAPGDVIEAPKDRRGSERVGPGTRRALPAGPAPAAEGPPPAQPAPAVEPVAAAEPAGEAPAVEPAPGETAAAPAAAVTEEEDVEMSPEEQAAFEQLMATPTEAADAEDSTMPPASKAEPVVQQAPLPVDLPAGAEEE